MNIYFTSTALQRRKFQMADVMEDEEKKKETTIEIFKKIYIFTQLISYANFKN